MLGRLEFASGGRGKGEWGALYGVPVLRARADPEGFFGSLRVRRAAGTLRRGGVVRTLLPSGFGDWEVLKQLGLRQVLPDAFLRFHAPGLTAESLRRRDMDPARATVALSGKRADGEMLRTARALCPQVRRLIIDAPDGERLARRLREEFGMPVLPREVPAHLAVHLQPGIPKREEPGLELYGTTPDLGGLRLSAPGLAEEEREDLGLMTVLWEWGKLDGAQLKFL